MKLVIYLSPAEDAQARESARALGISVSQWFRRAVGWPQRYTGGRQPGAGRPKGSKNRKGIPQPPMDADLDVELQKYIR